MAELQLRIGGHLVTEDEMAKLAECYPLTDSSMYMCWMGPTFQEPIDDDDVTTDVEDGTDEDMSDDVGPGDDDTDAGDKDGDVASMAVDFATNELKLARRPSITDTTRARRARPSLTEAPFWRIGNVVPQLARRDFSVTPQGIADILAKVGFN
ncbi:hypothetical protein H5410_056393 [Solanum commersonii]|uniref:Uncharacterized protein n=1 Tax=Solanum commersonii TaxID=4109 RepID=A0A9J5WK51_SOLCO|nr:hypothetical protein H5410_056393 [Solanum commersonii]